MKRIMLALLLALAACGGSDPGVPDTTAVANHVCATLGERRCDGTTLLICMQRAGYDDTPRWYGFDCASVGLVCDTAMYWGCAEATP